MVIVASGHMIDAADRAEPRFPPSAETAVAQRIDTLFADWRLGPDDVVFSGGARGADILFAESALRRDTQVRLFLALPPEAFVARSVALPGSDWERRFHDLLDRCRVDVLPGPVAGHTSTLFERVNDWMLHEARKLCPPSRLAGALVWDGQPARRGGAAHMAGLLRRYGVQPAVIDPMSGR